MSSETLANFIQENIERANESDAGDIAGLNVEKTKKDKSFSNGKLFQNNYLILNFIKSIY